MVDVNQVYQSEFLRAEQLKGQVRRTTIVGSSIEVLGQGEKAQQKIVLKLLGVKPRLPLNKTNAQTLSAAWGPQTDNWIGKELELRPDKVLFSGSLVDCIRVRVPTAIVQQPQPKTGAAAPPVKPPTGDPTGIEDLEDDVPW